MAWLSLSVTRIIIQHAYTHTHARTHTSCSRSTSALCPAVKCSPSKAFLGSPLSLQSHFPANNNVVLDSADPSDSKTSGTLRALKTQRSIQNQNIKGSPGCQALPKYATRRITKLAGNFSALRQMTKYLDAKTIFRLLSRILSCALGVCSSSSSCKIYYKSKLCH